MNNLVNMHDTPGEIAERSIDINDPEEAARIIFTMVKRFASNLPYSMDPMQPEFYPADFLNMTPRGGFKYRDRPTVFDGMFNWGDTRETSLTLQTCAIFQKMLSGRYPHDYELTDEDYSSSGISNLTQNDDTNRSVFLAIKQLPDLYDQITKTTNQEERRKALEEAYREIDKLVGGRFNADYDVYMYFYWLDPSSGGSFQPRHTKIENVRENIRKILPCMRQLEEGNVSQLEGEVEK